MRKVGGRVMLGLMMIIVLSFASTLVAFAAVDLDSLTSDGTTTVPDSNTSIGTVTEQPQTDNGSGEESIKSVTDYLRGYEPITSENMEVASKSLSPLVNMLGTLSGMLVVIASAGIFVVTALDLIYIGLPFTRDMLNPLQGAGQQMGGMPMSGGYGGGYGGRYGGMGGYGGMGMGGMGAQQPVQNGLRRKWVSDEAVYAVDSATASTNNLTGGAAGMGAMTQPGMAGQVAGAIPPKSAIFTYLKRRSVFLVIFALATVVLMSSLFTDCGINLAQLGAKIMDKLNANITNLNI